MNSADRPIDIAAMDAMLDTPEVQAAMKPAKDKERQFWLDYFEAEHRRRRPYRIAGRLAVIALAGAAAWWWLF